MCNNTYKTTLILNRLKKKKTKEYLNLVVSKMCKKY